MKRRTALGMMASATIAPTLTMGAARPKGLSLDPSNPDDVYLINRKVNYTYDDRPVFWYIEAVRYGLVDSAFIPFWRMHVGFLFKVASTGEFEFETKQLSAIFYADIDSGRLLETFDNPLTGERIPVRQPGVSRSEARFDKTRQIRESRERPGAVVTLGTDIGPAWIIGDDVWVHADTWIRAEPTGEEGRLLQVNDWSTYHASLTDVADPTVTSAPATMNFNDINTWPSWLNMGDQPGNYVSRGHGRKLHSSEGMPPPWLGFMNDLYPQESKDLVGAIDG